MISFPHLRCLQLSHSFVTKTGILIDQRLRRRSRVCWVFTDHTFARSERCRRNMSCVKFRQRASRPYRAGRRRWTSATDKSSRLSFFVFILVCNSSVLSDPCNNLKNSSCDLRPLRFRRRFDLTIKISLATSFTVSLAGASILWQSDAHLTIRVGRVNEQTFWPYIYIW